jgi:nucleotide-binding universal stress UspA family protein
MPAIKHILFPYDFSEQGALAVPFVHALADRWGAQITVMSVMAPIWTAPPLGMPAMPVPDPVEMEQELRARLDVAFTKDLSGLPAERITCSGDPALKITEFADSNAVDLIMIPTHGFGVFRSLLIGSVTAKVLHDARCPVWTATHAEEQQASKLPQTILCAMDDGARAPALLRWAADFSARTGAALKVMHVAPLISDWLAVPAERELQEQVREEARVNIEALRQSAGVEASIRIVVGPIADTITEVASQEQADLVLIGRGSANSTLGRLRTHVYGIVRKSPCPVLSV